MPLSPLNTMDELIDMIFHVNRSDIDLNQSLLDRLDAAQEMVEARLRQLEATEERRRQEQNPTGISLLPDQTPPSVDNDRSTLDENKPDGAHLVAKALEMNADVSKAENDRGSFYDCNICLDMASDPILTCCGHLFCWPCFFQVDNISSTSKECPVCKGEVSENTVTPIYGNGGESGRVVETESGLRIPPRPRAHRVESIRQQIVTHSINDLAIEEAIRQIRASLGATVGPEMQGNGRDNADNESGFLPENGDSLSSLTSVLSGADRLIEELEAVINSRRLRDDGQGSGGPELLPIGHPYSLRGRRRRRRIIVTRESRRRRLN
ncbi:RING/U-box superfamily protein [Striga asiatica]|uniref:E3 ubiquitin-protein ligase RMA n=1 Tax=Striga asiatica TaxID=4170 RepID=A0A5A7Q2Z9_STRAF|nr:RING/U-box superfamily protein [Striga asiatica]